MGTKQVHFCDFCGKEFGVPGNSNEALKVAKFVGNRHTDAAGSVDLTEVTLEMHLHCWKRFLQKLADQVEV